MQLSNTRYVRIDGTRVLLLAASEAEGHAALKELRHKNKEVLLWKRRLRRRLKTIETSNKREALIGMVADTGPVVYVARSLGAVVALVTGWNPFPVSAGLPRTANAVREDIATLDEVQLNVEEALLHLEGRLG